jgi:hypothetical protein
VNLITLLRFAGRLLEVELKQKWDTEAQKMQEHITQMATMTQSSIQEVDARSTRCAQSCSAGHHPTDACILLLVPLRPSTNFSIYNKIKEWATNNKGLASTNCPACENSSLL